MIEIAFRIRLKKLFTPICCICAVSFVVMLLSCEREYRQLQTEPTVLKRTEEYHGDAYAIAQGKRLYVWFNCVGCHAHGGGGIGPALMDDDWIHGSEPADIFSVIFDGTRDGMPSFGNRIREDEIWQLVTYVRSLSGLESAAASPGRSDHMQVKTTAATRKTTAEREFLERRRIEDALLHSYGWVDREAGIVRIPIDRAIELLVKRLPPEMNESAGD